MKPSAYKHIAAWHRLNELSDKQRHRVQRMAAKDNAPIDAVYYIGWKDGLEWKTIADVGIQTRMGIERQLNKGSR